ncbi:NAD(P)-binding protein [Microthyrium microscopicum]|uniref:Short-chain dehydrogenase/reductase 3 n=1 Tax=Microthyrium microscopicum TaxID=703497 RepID=A0A6A6UMU4_9PEZI|nr:NAD(P)-binding protein [Microthyrium microscopicum]
MPSLVSKLTAAPLNPWITGTLHWLLTSSPARLRLPLLIGLHSRLSGKNVEKLIRALKVLWLIGLARDLNVKLNSWALNNWTWKTEKDKWVWNWEVAVVTGGCSGIGKEIVQGLAAKGVKVAVLDIQALPTEFENNSKITFFHCDVTSPSSIAEAAKAVRTTLGEPSILVNNAGVGKPHSILDTTNEWVTKIFQINIISHFWLVKEFLPHMIAKNKGHIIGMASMASFVAPPGIVDYGSTKAAVMAFHEGLGQEIKHIYKTPGVLNTVVHPSWVRTPLVAGYEDHLDKTQGGLMRVDVIGKKIVNQILSCRGGQLIIPSKLRIAAGIRGNPNWLQELIRDMAVGKAGSKFPSVP